MTATSKTMVIVELHSHLGTLQDMVSNQRWADVRNVADQIRDCAMSIMVWENLEPLVKLIEAANPPPWPPFPKIQPVHMTEQMIYERTN